MSDLNRRNFIESSALALMGFGALSCRSESGNDSFNIRSAWKDNSFHHDRVDTSELKQGYISAHIDGQKRRLKSQKLPEAFIQWSLSERKERLKRLARHGFSTKDLAGPHNACVATYGGDPRDSQFSLNTAYKGMGFLPKAEYLKRTIANLKKSGEQIEKGIGGHAMFRNQMVAKIHVLASLYRDASFFDPYKQVSLELFSTPDYYTHTLLNMMQNPIASASFLAYPTFELRAIPQLLHPNNPKLSEYEKDVIDYVNSVHDFVHGKNPEGNRITCIYHIVEVFEDTPRSNAHGKRLV